MKAIQVKYLGATNTKPSPQTMKQNLGKNMKNMTFADVDIKTYAIKANGIEKDVNCVTAIILNV